MQISQIFYPPLRCNASGKEDKILYRNKGDCGILLYRVIYKSVFKNYMLGILYGQKTMETKSKNKKGISACDYRTACDNDNAGRLRSAR